MKACNHPAKYSQILSWAEVTEPLLGAAGFVAYEMQCRRCGAEFCHDNVPGFVRVLSGSEAARMGLDVPVFPLIFDEPKASWYYIDSNVLLP